MYYHSFQGAWKDFNETGKDYSSVSAYISYSPWSFLNIQAGHGKHFIGNGYRSLLLSDNAFNYPYLKLLFNYLNLVLKLIISFLQKIKHLQLLVFLLLSIAFSSKFIS